MFSIDTVRKFYARIRQLRPYFHNAAPALLGIAITTLVVAISEPMIPAMMKHLLDRGFVAGGLSLWLIPTAVIGLFTIRGVAGFIGQYFLAILSNNAMLRLRLSLFDKLQQIRVANLADHSASELANTLVYEIQNGMAQMVNGLLSLLKDGLTLLALLGYLLYLNWSLTLIVFAILPGVAWVIKYFSSRLGKLAKASQTATDDMAYAIEENVLAHRMVRLHHAQHQQMSRFDRLGEQLRRINIKSTIASAAMTPLTHIMAAMALSVVICIALSQSTGAITAGTFVSFIMAMLMIIAPIRHLTESASPIVRGLMAIERGVAFIASSPIEPSGTFAGYANRGQAPAGAPIRADLHSAVAPDALPSRTAAAAAPASLALLQFTEVRLQYRSDAPWVLDGVNLSVESGQRVAFVGASGSGKTSLINLLPRFYTQSAGQITLQGVPLQDWDLAALRRQFAYVSQDVVMFNASLAQNVALGDEQPDARRVEQALHAAYLGEFLREAPHGIETMVGHNAAKLSGGQRQRLAIARAIYKNAPILLLDEATSALDSESERAVQLALQSLMENRTSLVVAHRLSTIQHADLIVVMDRGRIVERGSHQALLNAQGAYAHLHQLAAGKAA